METQTYFVTGCGVSVICNKENVIAWIQDMLQRGGTPAVELYTLEVK